MFERIRQAFKAASAERQVKRDLERDIRIINAVGGANLFCLACVKALHQDEAIYRRLRTGTIGEEDFKAQRSTVALAAISSMMKARKDTADGRDLEGAKLRLEIAEETFRISWLIPSDEDRQRLSSQLDLDEIRDVMSRMLRDGNGSALRDLPHQKWADQRIAMGEEALEKWRSVDPYAFTFAVKV